jgi:hypothetical protein
MGKRKCGAEANTAFGPLNRALPPSDLPGVVEGLAQLSRNGPRYPTNHGIQKSSATAFRKASIRVFDLAS